MFTIANVLALALGACTFQPPTSGDARQPAKQTGCPTPTALANVAPDGQESAQASVSPAGAQEATTDIASADQLSSAEREAMLDRVNQGPARPELTNGASVPPAPGTESGLSDASATPDLEVASTPTPCS
jgi:hypothetical protein